MSAAKSRRAAKEQVTLEFSDNSLLAVLAGGHERNLVRLEQKLGVRVATRGNLVAIEGDAEMRERAATVLRGLYARIEAGDSCSASDVDAEIRFAAEKAATLVGNSFGSLAIRTAAGKATRARTPALKTEFRSMYADDHQTAVLVLFRPCFDIG
ncbi:MAG TPA: hypothetical protein VJ476_14430 [Rhizomicrobium sp.]|nr:hypothetical protein [Rhizomicrobium sp.]